MANLVSYYDPVLNAYREVPESKAQTFIDSALDVEALLDANPDLEVVSFFDPAIDAYHEISKANALAFIDSAKNIELLG